MKIKKLFNSIFLILIISIFGFAFWFGWEQLELSENSYGIAFTKTSGWSNKIFSSDNFNWSFEKIIPNNYTLHIFNIEDKMLNYQTTDQLPSGKLYAEFSNISQSNFEFKYNVAGNFRIKKESLLNFVKNGTFTSDNFESWLNSTLETVQFDLKSYIRERVINNEVITLNSSSREYLSDKYNYLSFSEININVNQPDILLYNLTRNRYIQNLEAQKTADEKYLVEMLKQKNSEKIKLDLLKEYGEVFTKYPIMIEYLKVDNNKLLDRAKLEDFISQ